MQNGDRPGKTGSTAAERPPIGLALGAGVGRGWAHIGVIKALLERGIVPDVVSGTSIGALVGGAYLGDRLDVLEDWARSLTRMRMLGYLDFKMRKSGLIGGGRLLALMRQHLGGIDIEDLPQPFIAIACDMVNGHEVWLRHGSLVDAVRASFSLPGIFPPVAFQGRWLVDGALVNPVPVNALARMGAQMTIGVNLNHDLLGRILPPGENVPRAAGFDILTMEEDIEAVREAKRNSLTKILFQRKPQSPSLFGTMVAAFNIAQDRLSRSRLAGEPPDVHITPRIGHIGPLEFDRADELIAEGRAAVERALPDLQAALTVLNLNSAPRMPPGA